MTTTPTIDAARLATLPPLKQGSHSAPMKGMCVMEAVAYVRGLPHSDHPPCVSEVIAAFGRSWNDALPTDEDRDRLLKPLIPVLVGTATTLEDEETRAWMATDWIARVHTPAWLRLAGLTAEAQALEACARIVDAVTARAAQPALDRAREARAAARAAASAAARDAASAAAWAWDAAHDAAWDVAWPAAWAAARDAARDAARAAASAAASDAAWAAAWAAVRDAAWDAARDALAPTVAALQSSAVELIRQMCAVGREEDEAHA